MAKKYDVIKVQIPGGDMFLVQPDRTKADGDRIEVDGVAIGSVQESYGRFIPFSASGDRCTPQGSLQAAVAELGAATAFYMRSNGVYDSANSELGRVRRRSDEWYVQRGAETVGGFEDSRGALNHLLRELTKARAELAA